MRGSETTLEQNAGGNKQRPYDGANGSVGALDATAPREGREVQTSNFLRELPKRLFQIVFRVVPYPTRPRLIRIGNPGRRSPVLVTTNYDLTVRRVRRALDGVDCWLLVAPAGGVDVWCAASGGRFTIESIISILKTTRIGELVDHRRLILPQLCATGINLFELRRRTGWAGVFGPVQAEDVPEYLRTRRKPEAMMRVPFALRERLEMAIAMWGSLTLRYTLFPCIVFGWRIAPGFALLLALMCLGVSLGCFVLPGKTFVQKAGFVALPVIVGLIGSLVFLGQGRRCRSSSGLCSWDWRLFWQGLPFPVTRPFGPAATRSFSTAPRT